MRFAVLMLLVGLAGAALLACGGDGDSGAEGAATASPTPSSAASSAATGTPDDGAADLFGGTPVAEFFAASCASCHGADRQGIVGPALTRDALTEADEVYFDAIANGVPGTAMPAWRTAGPLTDAEISALVTFLKTTGP